MAAVGKFCKEEIEDADYLAVPNLGYLVVFDAYNEYFLTLKFNSQKRKAEKVQLSLEGMV